MPEAVITMVVVAVMISAVLVALAALQSAQRSLDEQVLATQVLSEEVAAVRATDFVDVLQSPADVTGAPPLCTLGSAGLRTSAQSIAPTSLVEREGRVFTVTRAVTWAASGDAATCDATPNDRADIKDTAITVSWQSGDGTTRTKQASVWSTRASDPGVGPQIVVTR